MLGLYQWIVLLALSLINCDIPVSEKIWVAVLLIWRDMFVPYGRVQILHLFKRSRKAQLSAWTLPIFLLTFGFCYSMLTSVCDVFRPTKLVLVSFSLVYQKINVCVFRYSVFLPKLWNNRNISNHTKIQPQFIYIIIC